MSSKDKTNEELLRELNVLKQENAALKVKYDKDITECKKAEEKLKESENQLLVILESTADGILAADNEGKLIKANARFAELWRIPKSLTDTKNDETLLNFVSEQLINPEEFVSQVSSLYKSTEQFQDQLKFKDGRVFDRYSAPLLREGVCQGRVWSFHDITERKRAEEALTLERNLLRALLDTIPDQVYFKDINSSFIRISKSLADNFGYSDPQYFIGKSDLDFFTEEYARPSFDNEGEIIKTGRPLINLEEKKLWPEGKVTWSSTTKVALRDDTGKIVGTFGISRDITERKQIDEILKKRNEQLFKLNAEKDKFFSIIAHDLKNPFITILGFSELLLTDYTELNDEERKYYIEEMKKSADLSYNLLQNLLLWSRSQTGRIEFNPQKLNLHNIIHENLDLVKVTAERKQIKLKHDLPDDLTLNADGDMLNTIIRNLLTNAIKFTNKGGIIFVNAVSNEH
ncbi:MAG: PAS domain S-box protein, partial [Parachlamydiaceae bacterium]|nr:PAS domain S-box protein [Parachlamydiaceae bacterium]